MLAGGPGGRGGAGMAGRAGGAARGARGARAAARAAAPAATGTRYVAVNRFRTKGGGAPAALEKRWADRPSRLAEMAGFRFFSLLRRVPAAGGPPVEDLDFDYFSFTVWADEASFQAWRQGDAFKEAHGGGNFAGVVGMIVSSARTLKGPPKLATFVGRDALSVPVAAADLPATVGGWRQVEADGVNLLEPESFVVMDRYSVPEGREAAFAAAAASPTAASAAGFRFASALEREGKSEDGCNFYATSIWSSREAYEAGKEALGRGALAEEFGAPGADPMLFEGKLVLETQQGA